MYTPTFTLNGNEAVRDEILLAIQGSTTSYQLYRNILNYLITKAPSGDAKYNFINSEYGYIEEIAHTDNESIQYRITAAGTTHFRTLSAVSKKTALDTYIRYVEENLEDIHADDVDEKVVKTDAQAPGGLKTTADWRAQKVLVAATNATADKLGDLDSILDQFIRKKPGGIKTLSDLLNNPVALQNIAANYQGASHPMRRLSEEVMKTQRITLNRKKELLTFFLEGMTSHCTRSPSSKNSKPNRERLATIQAYGRYDLSIVIDPMDELTKIVVPGSEAWQEKTDLLETAISADITKVHNDDQDAPTVDQYFPREIFTTRTQNVYRPGINALKDSIYADSGLAALDYALNNDFDPATKLLELLEGLLGLAQDLISGLGIALKYNAQNVDQFQELVPYSFYDLTAYGSAIAQKKYPFVIDYGQQTVATPFDSVNLPLLDLDSDSLKFFNCGDFLYMVPKSPQIKQIYITNGGLTSAFPIYLTSQFNTVGGVKANWPQRQFNFNFRRLSQPLYLKTANGSEIKPHLMWVKAGGGNLGIGRADKIDSSNYMWSYRGNYQNFFNEIANVLQRDLTHMDERDAILLMGKYLGLEEERYFDYTSDQIEWKNPEYEGIEYEIMIPPTEHAGDDEEYYVLCNLPFPINWDNLSTEISQESVTGLEAMQFLYYRRVGNFNYLDQNASKVLKKQANQKNRPKIADVPSDQKNAPGGNYLVDLPVSFFINNPFNYFNRHEEAAEEEEEPYTDKGNSYAKIKNKGNLLTRNPNFRAAAGKVMGAITPYIKNLPNSETLSANQLAGHLESNFTTRENYQYLKNTDSDIVLTDQEWCHLRGHGDGGNERVGNFVSGSKHCNTEQLAIESAQRLTTHYSEDTYLLKSTAYLLQDDSMKTVANQNYTNADHNYIANAYTTNLNFLDQDGPEPADRTEYQKLDENAPFAEVIRYKIYRRSANPDPITHKYETIKILDYFFEGQSEFFDKNMYRLLNETVRYVMNIDDFMADFNDFLEKEVPVEEED